jgi:O-antigen ligase
MSVRIDRTDLRFIPAAVFLFILPFTHTVALRLVCLLFAGLVAAHDAWRNSWPPFPCKLPLICWAGVCVLSLIWTVNFNYSVNELTNEVGYSMVAFLGFFYLTRNSDVAWRFWRAAIVASCIVISFVAIGYLARLHDWPINGKIGDRNAYSTYVVLVVPFLLLTLVQFKSHLRSLIWIPVILVLATGYFTLNRMMWIVITAEILIFSGLLMHKISLSRKSFWIRTAAIAVLCVVFAAAFAKAIQMKSGDHRISAEELEEDLEVNPRPQIWLYAIERIAERPLLGYGFGRGILRGDFVNHFDGNDHIWHAHNMLLNYALETGVLGVAVLLLLAGCLLREFWKLYRAERRELWGIGAFGITLLAGAILKSLTDDIIIRENSLLFWSCVGMVLSHVERCSRLSGRPSERACHLR